MARRPPPPPRRSRARCVSRDATSETWLLLLGIVGAISVFVSFVYPPVPPDPAPDRGKPLTMAQARASNRAVPVEARFRIPAARYRFAGGPAEREQAAECLATAALYEAGDDARDQQAVIQVILNRARARGFPRTICGVVYQGYSRMIGCQFSFTCDGSVARRPVHTGWAAARRAARRALAGRVFADVGRATHYHADWMVPYWRDSLVKIAQVGTHIFYLRQTTRRAHTGLRPDSGSIQRNPDAIAES